ncbi:MAG: putative ABC transporter permease [Agathobacter sp.]|nr:putative ABC transporter permease [Agathobacter sp.]
MKKRTYALCMIVAIVSFLGFLVENIWCAFTKGYIDNRSMFFPFLIGYGIAIILIYLILGTPDDLRFFTHRFSIDSKIKRILIYLGGVMICVSIGEILLGTLVEHVCGFHWWNYNNIPLHITQYTSVPTSLAFGALITTFMKFFFEPLISFFEGWNDTVLKITATILMAMMIGDFLYAAYKMVKTQGTLIRWRLFLKK